MLVFRNLFCIRSKWMTPYKKEAFTPSDCLLAMRKLKVLLMEILTNNTSHHQEASDKVTSKSWNIQVTEYSKT